jgi:hypothetical protein
MSSGNHVKPTYVAIEDRECSYNCPNPRGNGGRGGSRGGRGGTRGSYGRGRRGHGGGRGGSRANVGTTEESLSVTLSGEQAKQWEQWQKGKPFECLTSPDGQATNSFGTLPNTPTWAKVLRRKFLHLM